MIGVAAKMIGVKQAQRSMQAAAEEMTREQRREVGKHVAFVEQYIKRALTAPGPPGPRTRTGQYRRSIRSKIISGATDVTGIVGTRSAYSLIHEYGGKVTPKRRKWLTIPTRLASSGRTRQRSARSYGNLRFVEIIPGRKAVLLDQGGFALFVLVKRVKIPPRPMWKPANRAVGKRIEKSMPRALRNATDRGIKRHQVALQVVSE